MTATPVAMLLGGSKWTHEIACNALDQVVEMGQSDVNTFIDLEVDERWYCIA
jgi:hypothetical protein